MKLSFLVCLFLVGGVVASRQVLFAAFSGLYQASYIELGMLPASTPVKATLRCTQPTLDTYFYLSNGPNTDDLTGGDQSQQKDPLTFILTSETGGADHYWLDFYTDSFYAECSLQVEINGFQTKNVPLTLAGYDLISPIHKISVTTVCKLKVRVYYELTFS